jgi:isoquinoline 1-oxidoreductase subunit beta
VLDTVAEAIGSGQARGLAIHKSFGSICEQVGEVAQGKVTLAQCPIIETIFVDSAHSLGGIGKLATPPITPAIANAIFALTGRSSRSIPLAKQHQFA